MTLTAHTSVLAGTAGGLVLKIEDLNGIAAITPSTVRAHIRHALRNGILFTAIGECDQAQIWVLPTRALPLALA